MKCPEELSLDMYITTIAISYDLKSNKLIGSLVLEYQIFIGQNGKIISRLALCCVQTF